MKLTGFNHEGPDGELSQPCEDCQHWAKVHPDDASEFCICKTSTKFMSETRAGDSCAKWLGY